MRTQQKRLHKCDRFAKKALKQKDHKHINTPLGNIWYPFKAMVLMLLAHNNCWLNSSVQVMCGTTLKTLIVREEFRDDSVIILFEEAVRFLSLQYVKHKPRVNQVHGCLVDLTRYVTMRATERAA